MKAIICSVLFALAITAGISIAAEKTAKTSNQAATLKRLQAIERAIDSAK